jgi:hypothetical protein
MRLLDNKSVTVVEASMYQIYISPTLCTHVQHNNKITYLQVVSAKFTRRRPRHLGLDTSEGTISGVRVDSDRNLGPRHAACCLSMVQAYRSDQDDMGQSRRHLHGEVVQQTGGLIGSLCGRCDEFGSSDGARRRDVKKCR